VEEAKRKLERLRDEAKLEEIKAKLRRTKRGN
jgi:hypothetical protein